MNRPGVFLLSSLIAVACGPADPGLEIVSVELPNEIAIGGSAEFVMTTINVSDDPVVVESRRHEMMSLYVTDSDGSLIWHSFPDVSAAVLARQVVIPPGQSDSWTEEWPLVDSEGAPVAPGVYFVSGRLGEEPKAESGRKRINVVP